jgi:hypothetical protein
MGALEIARCNPRCAAGLVGTTSRSRSSSCTRAGAASGAAADFDRFRDYGAAHRSPYVQRGLLARATEAEKQSQLDRLADFQTRHAGDAETTIRRLQDLATGDGNVFDELMKAARVCSLGRLTDAFFEVGGQYRRNM